ncbi:myo-inositol-1(or 4)-monophosphatase [Pararhizobium capsulatum DSM 1112]|uniref:Myo-inositol-1(Or 4)-monophosphatase n=1 Tax=Pararhizobium capsulatum DSM 1112 TaxID=1121113 RepID=A0ABU0BNT1_9HYPH|nr:3'(2'),5'-bisphosphate nucleotidase CysQ [Pararhizobium capsulatum]MDQ0319326.1 myo-inositol-1(or 4)-monophosphatase [Pararhizobium capsulatum DSM 1112]
MNAVHPSPEQWLRDLDLIVTAAKAAGEKALTYFRQNPDVQWKNGGRSPVSEADFAANDILKEKLLAARPNYGWLSEETDDDEARLGCETVFVVDPIDGTRAFIAGKNVWCVSVAVVHGGRPVAGVLYAPALDELFEASLTSVARKNGMVITASPGHEGVIRRIALAEDVIPVLESGYRTGISRVPHVPSLAYRIAMIADGTIDGTVVKKNSHDWDIAAADLILRRAGGSLCDLQGQTIVYNRPDVTHGVMCAAENAALSALIAAAQGLESH